ncbi:hypothetical protein ACJX0J_027250, partial [Zea mays]
ISGTLPAKIAESYDKSIKSGISISWTHSSPRNSASTPASTTSAPPQARVGSHLATVSVVQPHGPWRRLPQCCDHLDILLPAVWNAITNNQVVQGFRRSLHDDLPTETRLSHMLSRGSLEWLLNMRNMKLWMVRMTMMRMMIIMIQRELLEGKGNRANDLQSASSSEQRRCALCKALELPLLQSLNLQRLNHKRNHQKEMLHFL